MVEISGRFSLEDFKRILMEEEKKRRKKWEEEKERALEILRKVTNAVLHKKPRKVLLTFEKRPPAKVIEKLKQEIEWEKYPEWILEIEQMPKEEKRVVVLTRPLIIRRLLGEVKPPYPNVRLVPLQGASNIWHKVIIVPESRNLLQDLRLKLNNFRESQEITVNIEGIELEGFVAIPKYKPGPGKSPVGIGHIFVSDVPFLWTLIPINAPTLAEASMKAVLIWNYHDEPMKIRIVHLQHGTEDVVEIPPHSFLIFVHKFTESLPLKERKEKAQELLKKLEERGISKQTIKTIERFIASHNWQLPEELHRKFAEKAAEKLLREKLEEIKRQIHEKLRDWIIL